MVNPLSVCFAHIAVFDPTMTLSPSPRLMKCLPLQEASNLFPRLLAGCLPRMMTRPPTFSHTVSALGTKIDVQYMPCGVVAIDNTAGCKGDLLQILDGIILSKKLGCLDALRLRGKLQFDAGQFAGRLARKSLNVVTKHAYSMCGVDLEEPAVSAFEAAQNLHFSECPHNS